LFLEGKQAPDETASEDDDAATRWLDSMTEYADALREARDSLREIEAPLDFRSYHEDNLHGLDYAVTRMDALNDMLGGESTARAQPIPTPSAAARPPEGLQAALVQECADELRPALEQLGTDFLDDYLSPEDSPITWDLLESWATNLTRPTSTPKLRPTRTPLPSPTPIAPEVRAYARTLCHTFEDWERGFQWPMDTDERGRQADMLADTLSTMVPPSSLSAFHQKMISLLYTYGDLRPDNINPEAVHPKSTPLAPGSFIADVVGSECYEIGKSRIVVGVPYIVLYLEGDWE